MFIRYALHVVGDIHQPLHTTTLYNTTFPTGDLGGNLEEIGNKHYYFLKKREKK